MALQKAVRTLALSALGQRQNGKCGSIDWWCAVPRTLPPLVGVEVAAAQRRGRQLADAGKHLRGAIERQC